MKSGTDFYETVNGTWIRQTILPPTETRITQAYFMRNEVNRELDQIIRSSRIGPIPILLRSWDHAAQHGLHGLSSIFGSLQASTDTSARLGWMLRHSMPAPFTVSIQGDPRDHSRCRVFIEEATPRIGLADYWSSPDHTETRKRYAAYCERLATIVGLPIGSAWTAEREIARAYPYGEDKKRYNMLSWSELTKRYSGIDWSALFDAWGLAQDRRTGLLYNVTAPKHLAHISHAIRTWNSDRWTAWLTLLATQWLAGLSPEGPLRSSWFSYNRRFLQGTVTDETPETLRMEIVRTLLPSTLGRIWVARSCDPSTKREVTRMTKRILDAAATSIRSTIWMAKRTRLEALKKLRAIDLQICWPETWDTREQETPLEVTDYVGNLLALAAASTDQNASRLTDCRITSSTSWDRPVFEVNAFYYPEQNRMVIPAAILRAPLYDPTKNAAWNYGAIGATIGHELCHAFDSDGRRYDAVGDLRDWWSPTDDREYRRRASQMVKLFESVPYRGMKVNGELTLIENIADLGGLEFALAGLRAELGSALSVSDLREFFRSYAISWRSKDRLRKARQLLETDVHAPPALRVNHIVRQMDAWYEAYDLPVPPERIQFFGGV